MSDLTLEQMGDAVKAKRVYPNAVVVANIIELVTSVITNVSDKEDSKCSSVTRVVLGNMVASRIKDKVMENSNVK